MKFKIAFIILLTIISNTLYVQIITNKKEAASFLLTSATQSAAIYVDAQDDWLVHKTATLLQHDIEMVTGKKSVIISNIASSPKQLIMLGTVDGCDLIHKLANEKELSIDSIKTSGKASPYKPFKPHSKMFKMY